jgi:mannose-6-phosphate isomerase-like protein (cupin superfamily)
LKIVFDTKKYIEKITKSDNYFHTFINQEKLAAGILRLEPCEEDTQEPHESDEIYYIVKGDGFLKIDKKDYPISEGMLYYVGKKTPHKFYGNKKELVVLYVFGGLDI